MRRSPFTLAQHLIPRKEKHEDELAANRRSLFSKIAPTSSRRLSFRTYWRRASTYSGLRGIPRRDRRATVLRWYRTQKHPQQPEPTEDITPATY